MSSQEFSKIMERKQSCKLLFFEYSYMFELLSIKYLFIFNRNFKPNKFRMLRTIVTLSSFYKYWYFSNQKIIFNTQSEKPDLNNVMGK